MTSSGLEIPPVQKAYQMRSICPRISPVSMARDPSNRRYADECEHADRLESHASAGFARIDVCDEGPHGPRSSCHRKIGGQVQASKLPTSSDHAKPTDSNPA